MTPLLVFALALVVSTPVLAQQGSQPRSDLPQPYTTTRTWA